MLSSSPRVLSSPASSTGDRPLSAFPPSSSSSSSSTSPSPVSLHCASNSRVSRFSYDADCEGQHVHVTQGLTSSPPSSLPVSIASHSRPPPSAPSIVSASPSMAPSSSSSTLSSLRQRNANVADASDFQSAPSGRAQLAQLSSDLKAERRRIRLLTAPIQTLTIFTSVVRDYLHTTTAYLLSHRTLLYSLLSTAAFALLLYTVPGPHQPHLSSISHWLSFGLLWLTLGVLSSVGLGTGLHTFVLYLGPYIAKTTLAVTECNTLDIALSGPEAFLCPTKNLRLHTLAPVTFVGLLIKVAPAALLWGAGTAMGELPPYFVSRAATLSGQKLADLDALTEIEEHSNPPSPSFTSTSTTAPPPPPIHLHLSIVDRLKLFIYHCLQRYGFWAIVVFASIPNPLFDLAGLACGHFLIPFWTFFGATVIGKALIKAQMQTALVIVAFNRERLEAVIHSLEANSESLKGKLGPFFERQRAQFHVDGANSGGASHDGSVNYLSVAWNVFLACMILFFLLSIVDSSVQERLATQDQARIERFAQEKGVELKANDKVDK